MRSRALLGGSAFLAAATLWHRGPADDAGRSLDGQPEAIPRCTQIVGAPLCGAVSGLTRTLHSPMVQISGAGRLPPAEVPGATDPAVTQANIGETICRSGYSRDVRPSYAITGPLKRRMMAVQHPGASMAEFELDHLIPISLGGAVLDARNLWLQPRDGQANAEQKNAVAYVLWWLVCEHRLPLATARTAISRDWIAAYETYATPENVARYHFRQQGGRQRTR